MEKMIDPNEHERAAMMLASERAGEFIESLGVTDMVEWSREQWGQFIEVICTGYIDKLIDLRWDIEKRRARGMRPSDSVQGAISAAMEKIRTVG
jgi:hypothetical protein